MRGIQYALSAIVATALVLVPFPATAVVGSWSTPADLSLVGQDADSPQVVVDSTGLATAVWHRWNGSNNIIQSSTSLAGSTWSTTPVDISLPGQNASQAQVTVDSTGLVTAVWRRFDGFNTIIQSSSRPSGGNWSTPADLSLPDQDARNPQVTVDSIGRVTAVWMRYGGSNQVIQSSTRPSGGTWSPPVNASLVGVTRDANDPQVTVDSTGLATAVWNGFNGSDYTIQSSTSLNGGTWSTPVVDVSLPGGIALQAQVTVDSTGLVTAVWYRYNGSNYIIQSSSRPSGGNWSTPVDLSVVGEDAYGPQVTVDSTGLATAIWYRYSSSGFVIQSSTRPRGGTWSITPVDISIPGENASLPQVTLDSTGLVTAVWRRYDGSNNIIQSSTRPTGGIWSTPVNLSLAGQAATDPQVAANSAGLVTAVWKRNDGSRNIIQSSSFATPTPTPTLTPTPTVIPTPTPTPTASAAPSTQPAEVGTAEKPAPLVQRSIDELVEALKPVIVDIPESPPAGAPVLAEQSALNLITSTANKVLGNSPSLVLVGGEYQPSRIVILDDTIAQVVTPDGGVMSLQAKNGETPNAVDESGRVQMAQSNVVVTQGSGLAPNTEFAVYLFSQPTLLGIGKTNDKGEFFASFAVDSNIPLGDHTLQVNGLLTDGRTSSVSIPVRIVDTAVAAANEEAPPVESPTADIFALFGLALLVLGLRWFWAAIRRRKKEQE